MSVIIYQEHCEWLEKENDELKREVIFLRTMLEYKSLGLPLTDEGGESTMEPDT
jgi:hypothetical protein